MVERFIHIEEATGSIPVMPTNFSAGQVAEVSGPPREIEQGSNLQSKLFHWGENPDARTGIVYNKYYGQMAFLGRKRIFRCL